MPATPVLIAALALAGAVAARLLRHGARGSLDRTGQALGGLLVGLVSALVILGPRLDVVEDGSEIWIALLATATLAASFALSWAWEGRA